MRILPILATATALFLGGCAEDKKPTDHYDTIIRGGTVYDGLGGAPYVADVAIDGDRIAKIGDLSLAVADTDVDATGKAVSPGFINMLSWAVNSSLHDGRGLSDVKQGVTLEVFGEGDSWGPLSDYTRPLIAEGTYRDKTYEPQWQTLGQYLEHLQSKGISPNVASFIGASTVRMNQIGSANRAPTATELEAMKAEVRVAMEEGALGLGSSLIYAPAFYSKTDELVSLAQVVGEYNGMYISHLRSEGNTFLEALEELITIAREGGVAAEVYHLKASGKKNWHKMDLAIKRIEKARAEGLAITADMYSYQAGSTGLDAAMPPWVQEGGYDAWAERLKDPAIRAKVKKEMQTATNEWENLLLAAGPEGMLLSGFENPDLRHLVGKRLSDIATERGQDPEDVAIDLVIEDGSRVGTIYFLMSEENTHKQAKLPWVSFGSDSEALDPALDRPFGNPHPRAYGNFTRVIGPFVRDEKLMPMQEAIRKLSHLPATNLKLRERGSLQAGYYADVVVFDPATVQDHATFAEPHALASGVNHVWVNGRQVLKDGEHTGATPGRVVRGPGWVGWAKAAPALAAAE
ncbi:MAG: D-aminoacylase [Kordiimonadaceae bacterium]|nr:D-aminoacylase [Kordiimonadaceae bacterium]